MMFQCQIRSTQTGKSSCEAASSGDSKSEVDDLMNSLPVLAVLELGFTEQTIRQVLQQHSLLQCKHIKL